MGSFKNGQGGAGVGFGLGAPLQHVKCNKLRRHLTLDVSMSHGNLEFTRLIQPFFNIFFSDFWELTLGNSKSPDSVFASFSTCFSAYAFPSDSWPTSHKVFWQNCRRIHGTVPDWRYPATLVLFLRCFKIHKSLPTYTLPETFSQKHPGCTFSK